VNYLHPSEFQSWHAAAVSKVMDMYVAGVERAWYQWYWDHRNDPGESADYIRERLDEFQTEFAILRLRGNNGTSR
jgi:hypothetical protein